MSIAVTYRRVHSGLDASLMMSITRERTMRIGITTLSISPARKESNKPRLLVLEVAISLEVKIIALPTDNDPQRHANMAASTEGRDKEPTMATGVHM